MLALTKEDVDFENNQISITKTYYRTERRDIITTPKTEQSVRVIDIPQFLQKLRLDGRSLYEKQETDAEQEIT